MHEMFRNVNMFTEKVSMGNILPIDWINAGCVGGHKKKRRLFNGMESIFFTLLSI